MRRYLVRKLIIYILTFFVAATIDWILPRLVSGNPISILLSKMSLEPGTYNATYKLYMNAFGFNRPWWKQYLTFWTALFHGNLGISIYQFPKPVTSVIADYVLFTLALLIPAILLAYFAGNRVGAMAARRKLLDNTVLPVGYLLTATAYPWLALLLAFLLAAGGIGHFFPISGGFSYGLLPSWNWTFVWSLVTHWFLPFLTLFLVAFGGWAIGMRNLIIYELESDYTHYLEALGAPTRLVRRYAYRNAVLPQLTGLALSLGMVVSGAVVTEVTFAYPGVGWLVFQAVSNNDYFLLQGIFLFIIAGVLIANFVIDIVYVIVDPRTRVGISGA
ncbi:MAG: ABC transporter permease [Acidimicrobiales bacterium]